jgi:hypothetical protein
MRFAYMLAATIVVELAGCGEHGSRHEAPTVEELRGSYDVTIQSDIQVNGSSASSVASAGGDGDELHVFFPTGVGIDASGTLQPDGTVELEGVTTNGDARAPVHGNARVEKRSGILRIIGSLTAFDTFDFEMRRPIDADARPFAGRFRLAFEKSPGVCRCATTADVTIDVERRGFGTMSSATEVDATGAAVGAIGALFDLVLVISPSGRFALQASYETPPGDGCAVSAVIRAPFCILFLDGTIATAETAAPTSAHFDVTGELGFNVGSGDVTISRLQ